MLSLDPLLFLIEAGKGVLSAGGGSSLFLPGVTSPSSEEEEEDSSLSEDSSREVSSDCEVWESSSDSFCLLFLAIRKLFLKQATGKLQGSAEGVLANFGIL